MSLHYSKCSLNTYRGTPYFMAHVPADYPLELIMQKCRAFRKLPPRVRELATRAKRWTARKLGIPDGVGVYKEWYDKDGYELDPETGRYLTDKEVEAGWTTPKPDIKVEDIPETEFADPDTWEEPPPEPDLCDRSEVTPEGIKSVITRHGRHGAALYYGVPTSWLAGIHTDEDLVKAVMGMDGKPWPAREEVVGLSIKEGDPPEVISPPEFELWGIGEVTENAREPMPADKEKKEEKQSKPHEIVAVWRDWDDLKAVLVGRNEHDSLPAWIPDWEKPDGNILMEEKKEGAVKSDPGTLDKDAAPKRFRGCIKELEAFCELLESEGVKVHRPSLLSVEVSQQEPVGMLQQYPREQVTTVGQFLVPNQTRASFRNKERAGIEELVHSFEKRGVPVLRPPPCSYERNDDLLNDHRPFIEGGDIYRIGKDVLVGCGGLASSSVGIRWLAEQLEPYGMEVWPAYPGHDWFHLDYILQLVREGLCIAHRKGFVDGLLPTPIVDWDCIDVTHDEADSGAANGICLRPNVVMIMTGFPRLRRALEKKGVDVIEVKMKDTFFWGGGPACSTSELLRGGNVPQGVKLLGSVSDERKD